MSYGGGNGSGREKRGGWEKKRETAVQRGLVAAEVVLAQREDAAVLDRDRLDRKRVHAICHPVLELLGSAAARADQAQRLVLLVESN